MSYDDDYNPRNEIGELRDAVREVSSDLRQFMKSTIDQIGKLNDVMAQSARNEERFITILEDNKRIVADMKEMRKIQDEQKAKCERNAEKLDDLRGSHRDLAIRFEAVRDEYKEFKHRTLGIVSVVAIFFGSVASFVVSKVVG